MEQEENESYDTCSENQPRVVLQDPVAETMQAKGYGFDALRFTLYSVFRVRSKRYRRGKPVDIDTRAG